MASADRARLWGVAPATSDPALPSRRGLPTGATDRILDLRFGQDDLYPLRSSVAAHAASLGLSRERVGDLVVIANELATNAVRHGGGRGRLRLWRARETIRCSVSDDGHGIARSDLVGRDLVSVEATAGRGLWIVRWLADDVDIETSTRGATITASVNLGGRRVR